MTQVVTPGSPTPASANLDVSSDSATPPIYRYFQLSELPLASLLFVLPMIVVYEVGTRWYATDPIQGTEQRIVAFNLMRQFFTLMHVNLPYWPCVAVVALLLGAHWVRKDPWIVRPSTLLGMLIESALLAFPLLIAGQALVQYMQHLHLAGLMAQDRYMIIISFGAGVYEELVFRLFGFAVLSFLFRDLLHLSKPKSMLLMVVCSAFAFSLYHYLGHEHFQWQSFLFRTVAGFYFGVLFVFRGFGVTAGTHAAYDIIVSLLH